ncbi:hypothetical protein ACSS6W_010821 [Trichoderma asperelloides]|nr:hypothetical protein LI328DRAFT_161850 [Trichoderma asperelloides]
MCLPCFPWTWTEYEDPLDSMPEQHVWVHDGQTWSLQRCSPKTPRRLKTGCEPLRQVHFHSPGSNADTKPTTSFNSAPFSAAATTTANGESINVHTAAPAPDNQPTSFPQLGAPPHSTLGSDQWHTSIDPSQSVKLPGQPFAGGFAPGLTPGFTCAPPQTHLASPFSAVPQVSAPFTTYIGIPPQLHQHQHLLPQHHFTTASMADYQNAAPMASGVNFQPPVPDTTFGPIPHVYVPRFDGGFVPAAVQVGLPSVQFVSAPAAACSTTVVMPKTFCYYSNGFTYYAIAHSSYVVAQQPAVVPQPFVGQQPVMIGGQPATTAIPFQQMPAAVPAMGMSGAGGVPVITGNGGQIPDVSGLGRTPGEETVRQLQFAHANKLFEPQEFKPSDDDPSRFYYVREVDGNWTQRNRFTIDHLGDCRWYVTDEGWFYAVRMPN